MYHKKKLSGARCESVWCGIGLQVVRNRKPVRVPTTGSKRRRREGVQNWFPLKVG